MHFSSRVLNSVSLCLCGSLSYRTSATNSVSSSATGRPPRKLSILPAMPSRWRRHARRHGQRLSQSRSEPNGSPARVLALRHAVGEQAQPVAGEQFDRVFLVFGARFDAEQQPATLQRLDPAWREHRNATAADGRRRHRSAAAAPGRKRRKTPRRIVLPSIPAAAGSCRGALRPAKSSLAPPPQTRSGP